MSSIPCDFCEAAIGDYGSVIICPTCWELHGPNKGRHPLVELDAQYHLNRHVMLHRCLDELWADWIVQHPDNHMSNEVSVRQLLHWSHEQSLKPTTPEKW